MRNDTLSCILDFCQLFDILNCSLVCKQFDYVAKNELYTL